jgi:Pectate lyase superfamily protein
MGRFLTFLAVAGCCSLLSPAQSWTSHGDITQAMQMAVNSVGNAGGGSVRIPAGTFSMSGAVNVPYSNVSIEGTGSGQTIINVSSNYASDDGANDGLFAFGRAFGAATNDG